MIKCTAYFNRDLLPGITRFMCGVGLKHVRCQWVEDGTKLSVYNNQTGGGAVLTKNDLMQLSVSPEYQEEYTRVMMEWKFTEISECRDG